MKKIFYLNLIFILIVFSNVYGKKLMVLPEVLNPQSIEVQGGRVFVVQEATVFVYSLKDQKLIAKFGRRGEGPGEFKIRPGFSITLTTLSDKILVEGINKVIFYSRDFMPVKEIKKKGILFQTMSVGENFVAVRLVTPGLDKKYYLSLSLYDSEMNLRKELHRQEFPERESDITLITDTIHFAVYKDRIYVEESDQGFQIDVFDSTGNMLTRIKKDFPEVMITEKDKKEILDHFKQDDFIKIMIKGSGGWDNFTKTVKLIYPKRFPQIQDIMVSDDRIYVFTFEKKGDKEKCIIVDLRGNLLGSSFLSIPEKPSFLTQMLGRNSRFYGIANNRFYYLLLNQDEEWEIHEKEIQF